MSDYQPQSNKAVIHGIRYCLNWEVIWLDRFFTVLGLVCTVLFVFRLLHKATVHDYCVQGSFCICRILRYCEIFYCTPT